MLSIEFDAERRVVMKGRLDASQAAAAQAFLDQTSGVVTIDCAGVEHLASAGLGVLLKTHKRLMGGGGKLRLKGPSKHLRDILGYAGFDHLLEIEA